MNINAIEIGTIHKKKRNNNQLLLHLIKQFGYKIALHSGHR